jgi:uncharacterized protein YkwD
MSENGDMRRSWLAFLCVALASVASRARPASVSGSELSGLERRIFQAVNAERRERGLAELRWSEPLAAEARRHSRRMAARWFTSHDDPERGDLTKRLAAAGIPWRECAENILSEQGYEEPGAEAVKSWMASPGHRRNILNPRVTHTGVGAALRADGTLLVTQEFTRPS